MHLSGNLPKGMLRNGRPEDQSFLPDEELYIRFNNMLNGKINPADIKYPNQSVNRGKYSDPEWVLIVPGQDLKDWGIGGFQVGDIPCSISNNSTIHTYQVRHVPQEQNYSHSEIQAMKDGLVITKKVKSKQLKQKYRVLLSLCIKTIRPAAVDIV